MVLDRYVWLHYICTHSKSAQRARASLQIIIMLIGQMLVYLPVHASSQHTASMNAVLLHRH
jgi:hypothetical protein